MPAVAALVSTCPREDTCPKRLLCKEALSSPSAVPVVLCTCQLHGRFLDGKPETVRQRGEARRASSLMGDLGMMGASGGRLWGLTTGERPGVPSC